MWVNRHPAQPGHFGYKTAWLKDGPQVAKTVTYWKFGDPATREVKNRELRFRTSPRRAGGWDFDAPTKTWACENGEIEKLLAFLQNEVGGSGRYRLVDTDSPQAALLDLLAGNVDLEQLAAALIAGGNAGQLVAALSRSAGGLAVHLPVRRAAGGPVAERDAGLGLGRSDRRTGHRRRCRPRGCGGVEGRRLLRARRGWPGGRGWLRLRRRVRRHLLRPGEHHSCGAEHRVQSTTNMSAEVRNAPAGPRIESASTTPSCRSTTAAT